MAKFLGKPLDKISICKTNTQKPLYLGVFGRLERPNNPKTFSQFHHDRFVRLRVNYLVIIINFILNVKAKMRWFVK